jgi:hypothetical protein
VIDTNRPDGASIEVPNPVEIPPGEDPIGIPVPQDEPPPDSLPPRESGVVINDPIPERSGEAITGPLLP